MAKPPEHVGTRAVSSCPTGGSQLRAGSTQRRDRSGPSSQESRPTADGELPAGGRPEEFRMSPAWLEGGVAKPPGAWPGHRRQCLNKQHSRRHRSFHHAVRGLLEGSCPAAVLRLFSASELDVSRGGLTQEEEERRRKRKKTPSSREGVQQGWQKAHNQVHDCQ